MAGKKNGDPKSAEAFDALGKQELVARAKALGIDGAEKFTRLELVDEIRKAEGVGDRGLLGRARELLKDVVEKGLARAVGVSSQPSTPVSKPEPPAERPVETPAEVEPPVPTVTPAEIYAAQGHLTRARAIVREVLRANPNDEAAKKLQDRLEQAPPSEERKARPSGIFPDDPYGVDAIEPEAFVEPQPAPYAEVPSMLDDAPWPARYDLDECVAMAVDPTTLFVYWETRPATFERARRALRAEHAKGTLRVLVVEPSEHGPRVSTRDFEVIDVTFGEYFVRDLPAGAIVRAAIGVREGDRFLPIAHTLDVEAPPTQPSAHLARDLAVWTENATVSPGEGDHAVAPQPLDVPKESAPARPDLGEPEDEVRLVPGLSSAELVALKARRRGGKRGPGAPGAGGPGGPSSASWLDGR